MSSIDKINVGGVDFDIKSSPTPVMAPVETGTTATQAYAVGDYVIVGSTLHEVTAAIAIDDTFTEGTNISASTSFGNEIKEIKEDLDNKVTKFSGTDSGNTYVTVDQLAYDATNKKLGLKVNGADTVIPFSSGRRLSIENTSECHQADQWYVPSTRGTYDVSAIDSGTFTITVTRYFGVTCIIKIDDNIVYNQYGGSGTYQYSINAKNVNTIYAQGYSTSIVYNP